MIIKIQTGNSHSHGHGGYSSVTTYHDAGHGYHDNHAHDGYGHGDVQRKVITRVR